jgi:phage gp46-like protein
MSKLRQGDILLLQTDDGGNIKIVNGEPEMDGGLESATYMSLFQSDGKAHWMEEYQTEDEKTGSQFYNFIIGNQKTVSNINRAITFIELDLAWMINQGLADEFDFDYEDINVNRSKFSISIKKDGSTISGAEFEINWGFQKENPGSGRIT